MGARGCKSGHRSYLQRLIFNSSISKQELSPTPTPQECGISDDFLGPSRKKKTKKRTRTKDGLPKRITTAQLQSPSELDSLYRKYTGDVIHFDFFALACRAVRKAKNPPGLFRRLLADNAISHISGDDDDQARQMLRQLRGEPCPWVQSLITEHCHQMYLPRPMTVDEQERRQQDIIRQLEQLAIEELKGTRP